MSKPPGLEPSMPLKKTGGPYGDPENADRTGKSTVQDKNWGETPLGEKQNHPTLGSNATTRAISARSRRGGS